MSTTYIALGVIALGLAGMIASAFRWGVRGVLSVLAGGLALSAAIWPGFMIAMAFMSGFDPARLDQISPIAAKGALSVGATWLVFATPVAAACILASVVFSAMSAKSQRRTAWRST